jgi:hypothetical protein
MIPHHFLIHTFPVFNDFGHFFTELLANYMSFFEICLLSCIAHFEIRSWARDMAQVAEYLPSKHKTLSLNPSITRKKKEIISVRVFELFEFLSYLDINLFPDLYFANIFSHSVGFLFTWLFLLLFGSF